MPQNTIKVHHQHQQHVIPPDPGEEQKQKP